jgi:hypothetical protein
MLNIGREPELDSALLRLIENEEEGIRCLGLKLGQTVTLGYKYRDMAQVVGWAQGWQHCSAKNCARNSNVVSKVRLRRGYHDDDDDDGRLILKCILKLHALALIFLALYTILHML